MNKPVNTIRVHMLKHISEYNLKTGEVGLGIQMYSTFDKLAIIPDTSKDTIRNTVLKYLDKECIDFSDVKDGTIFEESRIEYQTFEDENGLTWNKETPYFVDNSLYIEVNQGEVSMDELKEIFPEIAIY